MQHSPVAFDASTFEIWGALLNGGEVVILPPGELSLRALGAVIKDTGITSLWLTAGLFHAMVEERMEDFARVRQLLTGGDVVSPKHARTILERHPDLNLINGYGPTENTTFTCCHSITLDDVSGGDAVPIGTAISGTEIFVVDAELNQVADGQRGELVCAGDGVALGYWKNESLSSQAFVRANWDPKVRLYRTGDSVIRRPGGVVDFFGRIDQQVKIRGFRIELGEIETRILEIEDVQQVHVAAESVGDGADKVLIAHYVGDREIAKAEFQKSLTEKLAQHCIPSFYHRLDEIPLTPNGKVDRKTLPSVATLLSNGSPVNGSGKHVTNGTPANLEANTDTVQQISTAVGEVLGLKSVPRHTNFFDLGASSIQIARIHERVQSRMGKTFPVTDFFQFPNADLLTKHLDGEQETSHRAASTNRAASNMAEPIAVIGYAGRFPGANSVEALWDLICQGKDGLRDLSDEELAEKGVPLWMIRNDRYVKRGVEIDAFDELDADLFGISHREAEITDPQGRVFLETCHDALLHAGYPPDKQEGRIGLFGSSGVRSYSWRKISYSDLDIDRLTEFVGNEKDFLTTRVSYRLGLTGVSIPVQTACSSSLVAVHMARQSLLCGDSDIAIAGGVTINCPHGTGYMAAEGTMFSMGGRCRVFDQGADGTVFAPGVGAVILKRLSAAKADGDMIHAVLLGTGVNNDGNRKIGFMAPSIQGQSGAISDALGDLDAKDVRYLEAHGTATKLGDPIELTGLQAVYDGEESPECLVGSIKANLGHTDAAAGITGFIKAMLVAKHGLVPPTINHDKPTDAFDFAHSRFRVNTELEPLPSDGAKESLVGVSSFGIGGTNAHAVLSPPPPIESDSEEPSLLGPTVVPVSAGSKKSLRQQIENLEGLVKKGKPLPQDLAFSLCHGRPDLNWRAPALLIPDNDKGSFQLQFEAEENWTKKKDHQATAYLFTGQGAQYPKMAQGLYQHEVEFRETMDEICAIADPILGTSLKSAIFEGSAETLGETWLTQIALFAVEVANAKLWQSRGVVASALIGHSIGEYAAAVIAGVFTLQDATRAVIERGRLMWSMPAGKMAVFPLAADAVAEMIKDEPDLELATLNCPELNVIAGPEYVLKRFIEEQEAKGVSGRLLHTSHAFHTRMMDDALAPFESFLESLGPRSAPQIPIYSNVTGQRLTAEEATSAAYWAKHIRQPVRFEQCIRQALDDSITHFVEVGPGRTLSTFVRKSLTSADKAVPVETVRHPKDDVCDHATFLKAIGKYWAVGGQIDWNKAAGVGGKKIELPRYPYDRKRFWREPDSDNAIDSKVKNPDLSQWFYRPVWESAALPPQTDESIGGDLLVISSGRLSRSFLTTAGKKFDSTIHIRLGKEFADLASGKAVARSNILRDFSAILAKMERPPSRVIIAPTLGITNLGRGRLSQIHKNRTTATESILHLIQAAHSNWPSHELDLTLVSSGSCEVIGGDLKHPQDAPIRGLARVIALEFPQYTTRWIDIDQTLDSLPWTLDQRTAEFAVRNGKLWRANWTQKVIDAPTVGPFRDGQTFLITGGTSGVGLSLARRLGTENKVNIVLAARSELPDADSEEARSERFEPVLAAISEIEAAGSQVLFVKADVSLPETVKALKLKARSAFGNINGVFHAAGVLFDRPMLLKERVTLDQVLRPKIEGSWILANVFSDSEFLFLFSSISSAIPPAGQCDYSAGNNFMDALANQSAAKASGLKIISANWGSWREVGMAARLHDKPGADFLQQEYENGIDPDEGFDCIKRMVASGESQLAVYTRDFVSAYHSHATDNTSKESFAELTDDDTGSDSEPPATDLERQLLSMFAQTLKRRDIGVLDCFFDLGGDSLLAVGLLTRIRKETGTALPNSILFQAPHARALAAEIEKQTGSATTAALSETETETSNAKATSANFVIPIETEGSGVPVFGIHGAGGSVLFYRKTTQALVGLHPFYAIEDPLVKNSPDSFLAKSVAEKASLYLEEILKIYDQGPLVLIGYSFGAKIAVEIARIFNQQFPDRAVVILNIDQPATMDVGRRYGLKEKLMVAWNRPTYVSRPGRALFVASRFLGGLAWQLIHGPRLKRAYQMLQETGQMHENETVRFRQIEFHNNVLDGSHNAAAVDAHMVILKAADRGDKYAFPDDLGWTELVSSLRIIQVPGDHLSVVSEENQPFMAAQIGASIQQLLAQHGTP